MPVFEEDPAQFSKERLKSELTAHNVDLPSPDSKKRAYVQLYLKHVKTSSTGFSSDEEEDLHHHLDVSNVSVEDAKARAPQNKSLLRILRAEAKKEEVADMVDLDSLTDDQLKAKLLQFGVKAGPIVASTRALYEKKLKKLLDSSTQTSQHRVNGTGDAGLYSDSEEEAEREGGEDKNSESEQLRSETVSETSKTASNIENRFSPLSKQEIKRKFGQTMDGRDLRGYKRMDKDTMTGRSLCLTPYSSIRKKKTLTEPVMDVLSQMFPDTAKTPTGIYATKRRPIKGAAGRPVQYKYPEKPLLSPATLERQEIQHRLLPLWVQIVVFLLVACLLYLIYSSMEDTSSLSNTFIALIDGLNDAALVSTSQDSSDTDAMA